MYDSARMANLCKTQKEFAKFIGIDVATLSKAMNGYEDYLTDSLRKKIEQAFTDRNIQSVYDNHGTVITSQKSFAPTDIKNSEPNKTIYTLLAEMRAQRESYEHERDRLLTIIEKLTIK